MQILNLPVISSSIAVFGRPTMHSPSSAAPAAATPTKRPWEYAMSAGAFGIGTTVISSSIAAFDSPAMPSPSSAEPAAAAPTKRPWALYALTVGAFGGGAVFGCVASKL
jgi:DHA1 family inner membrane transport protein